MLKIRLQRRGKRNYATYRVVVAEDSAPVKGRFLADVGFYNPHTDKFEVNAEETKHWISQGAQPSDTVHNLLIEHKIIAGKKVTIWQPKKAAAAPEEENTAPTEAPSGEDKEAKA